MVDTPQTKGLIENLIWACGGMVDTLVLGTSAKAWEFESLHAHQQGINHLIYPLLFLFDYFLKEPLTVVFVFLQKLRSSTHSGILPRTAPDFRLRCKRVSSCPPTGDKSFDLSPVIFI